MRKAAARSGYTRSRRGGGCRSGTGRHGRGRAALATIRRGPAQRRVTVMARIVRHKGAQFRSAPLARHIAYLERDGVTRDGTRDLMGRMEKDLETRLDWVAVDHWNTDNPHIHILVRGVAEDGSDLVVDRAYMSEGVRGRASEIATLELGPRNEQEIDASLAREASAERWTGLDARLRERGGETGIVDLLPDPSSPPGRDRHLIGRAAKLETLGLATRLGPGIFEIDPRAETILRDLGERGDIIKGVHRAMRMQGLSFDASRLALHGEAERSGLVGRLVARGLDDELAGSAFAIVDGTDGRTHHIKFSDLQWTGDAKPGAIVELRRWEGRDDGEHLSLALRSDLAVADQISARGATWLDRELVAARPVAATSGFGIDVRRAMAARAEFLAGEGLASRRDGKLVLAPDLIETLRRRDLEAACETIAALGQHVTGTATAGGIDWSLGRNRGIAI